jgi:hypothetical protein
MEIRIKTLENVFLLKPSGNQYVTAVELNNIDERTGKRTLGRRVYHSELRSALVYLLDRGVKTSTATTLNELLEILLKIENNIINSLGEKDGNKKN